MPVLNRCLLENLGKEIDKYGIYYTDSVTFMGTVKHLIYSSQSGQPPVAALT